MYASRNNYTQDPGETYITEVQQEQQVIITAIRATDLTLGFRLIPAGFYIAVTADNAECQTSNKPSYVNQTVFEWNERILLPCELSSKVRVSVYASFELGPMLCHGAVLRTLEISVGELLDRSEKSRPIRFQPEQEEVVSPCTSLFMMVEQRLDENDAAVLCLLTTPTSRDVDALIVGTNAGHGLLARYRKTQNSSDLDQCINQFKHALDICPTDHPCRPAALFNLATAKFLSCQGDGEHLDLDIPIILFEEALDLRPTGHPDRPITQFHLAVSLLSRFRKRGFQTDADTAEELLSDVLDICQANSHIYRAALVTTETLVRHLAGSIDENELRQERPAASMLPLSSNQLADLAERSMCRDDPHALDEAISLHYDALRYYDTTHACRGQLLYNQGAMLRTRFDRQGIDEDLDEAITLHREALALRPVGHTDRSLSLDSLATQLSTRFDYRGNGDDLDDAITLQRESLALCPVGHTDRSWSVDNLATHVSSRFDHRGNDEDLDEAITLHREALALRPVGHIDRSWSLDSLATQLSTRFDRRGNDEDLDEAITLHREALALRPVGHTDRSWSLNSLATQLSTRFDRRGNGDDLDDAITLQKESLALCPVGHTDRAWSIDNLATRLSTRFDHRGNDEDLEDAITLHKEALALRPVGHMDRSYSLNNLANRIFTRFHRQGNDGDLDCAIAFYREALALCPVGHTDRFFSLHNLATRLSTLFDYRGNVEDLNDAIAYQREALALCPDGNTYRPMILSNLATQLSKHFEHQGNDEDLDQAIALQREGLTFRPVGHTDRFKSLHNLAAELSTRFHHRGNAEDLDDAITLQREALALCPFSNTLQPSILNNLANQLSTRFDHRGNDEDLDQAITLLREALVLCPVGYADRSVLLDSLANQLSTRFDHRGNVEDLDDAITLHREALAFRPVGHTDRSCSLNNLANRISTRFHRQGNDGDLDCAIALYREALALQPVGHVDRSLLLDHLATQLSTRFSHRGNNGDLDQAITIQREALALRPVGHTYRSKSLNNLATQLSTRFSYRGYDGDLDEAITLLREALALLPVGHTDRCSSLNNLANKFFMRFEHRGDDEDLDQAIALHSEALALRSVDHTDRSLSLGGLALQLSARFEHRGNDEDLDQAIALQREALALLPVGHTRQSLSLGNLSLQLFARFGHRGNDRDLDDAITLQREALALCAVGHPDRSPSLNNLATQLSARFKHRHNREDLHESREHLRCALTLLTQHDPRQLKVHFSLATVYLSFHHSGLDGTAPDEDANSLNAAMHHFKAAANVVSGGLLSRLRASLCWVRHADQHTHGTQLEAYATSMQLLDAYMSATASVSSRHNAMKEFPSALAVDAASCALRIGDVCRAIELLEQGRTLIWTQIARVRTPLDSLQHHGDHAVALMKKFRDLSSLLDKPPASNSEGITKLNAEAEATRYRRLVEEWNATVEEIRMIEGFSRFLIPPLFSDLQDAARDGPIIVLLASKSSCNAIIIPHEQPPISIQLPTNFEKLQTLVVKLRRASRTEDGSKGTQSALIKALMELWDDAIRLVVEKLNEFAPRPSRIWWCPTSLFNFLPLHAAGAYRQGEQLLSQLYISSYTPSLTALMRARKNHANSPSVPFAAIGQNRPDGASFTLECVEPELELVRSLLPPTVSFTKITSHDATKSRALRTMGDNTWLHFSCHGTQDYDEPFKSAFLMRDQPLSLLNISQMDLSRHEFAFLSACDTAVGVPSTPDEVIHLAAGLQFAGVKSVIGTLWMVNDSTVQRLVEEFYKNFCGDGKMNSKRAARALRRAVQSLARDKDIPLDQRIVFMHIGV